MVNVINIEVFNSQFLTEVLNASCNSEIEHLLNLSVIMHIYYIYSTTSSQIIVKTVKCRENTFQLYIQNLYFQIRMFLLFLYDGKAIKVFTFVLLQNSDAMYELNFLEKIILTSRQACQKYIVVAVKNDQRLNFIYKIDDTVGTLTNQRDLLKLATLNQSYKQSKEDLL